MSAPSSRKLIRDLAKHLGWKRLPSNNILTDRFGRNGNSISVTYSKIGNILNGHVADEKGHIIAAPTNRPEVVKCLKRV